MGAPALTAASAWGVFFIANAQRIDVVPFFNDLRAVYHVDYAGVGGLLSAYLLGYVLAQIPAGLAADNVPARKVTLTGLACMTVTSALFALTGRYATALALRFLMGLSGAALYSSTVKLMLGAAPNRGAAMGILQSGAGAGTVAGLFLMPLMSAWVGVPAAFLALAVATAVVLAGCAVWLPAGAPRRTGGEPALRQIAGIAGRRTFVFLSASVFLALFSAYGITAWLPTYLANVFGFSRTAAGGLAAVVNVALLAASPFAGTLSDRLGTRTPVILAGFGLLVASFALLAGVHSAAAVAVSTVLAGTGLALTLPILTTLTTELFGIQRAGVAVSLNLAVGQIASTISGVLFGYVLDATRSFTLVWILGLGLALAGFVPAMALRRAERSAGLAAAEASGG
ncbi:MAG TPA: MFS transporter [bacterium]|nr:MFS transporter [bacterium]